MNDHPGFAYALRTDAYLTYRESQIPQVRGGTGAAAVKDPLESLCPGHRVMRFRTVKGWPGVKAAPLLPEHNPVFMMPFGVLHPQKPMLQPAALVQIDTLLGHNPDQQGHDRPKIPPVWCAPHQARE